MDSANILIPRLSPTRNETLSNRYCSGRATPVDRANIRGAPVSCLTAKT